jgi:hypothetical protein
LHLLIRNTFTLRLLLGMIIFNGVVMHAPIAVMLYGANSDSSGRWVEPYSISEKVQVTVFFVQELILSGLYISETFKIGHIQSATRLRHKSRRLKHHVIAVNVIVIFLDITILGLEYATLYDLQTSYKALAYSVKLKLEFTILNRLVDMTMGKRDTSMGLNSYSKNTEQSIDAPGGFGASFDPMSSLSRPAPSFVSRAYADGYDGASLRGRRHCGFDEAAGNEVVLTTEIKVHRELRSEAEVNGVEYDPFRAATPSQPMSRSSSEAYLTLAR